MKRTIILIIFLLIAASLLIYYALNITPKKQQDKTTLTPTEASTENKDVENGVDISFFPESIILTSTDSATFDINIDTKENKVTGVQLEIGYNPELISDVQIQKNSFLPSASLLLNENDNKNGRLSYALVLPPTQSPVTGTGVLAKITFKKNINVVTNSQAEISILPKSLVSALGVEGSVLGKTKNASVTFSYFPTTIPLSNPSIVLTPTLSQ